MKKTLAALFVLAILGLNSTVVFADYPIDPGGSVECQSQYSDGGTTHFVYCWDCSSVIGTPGGTTGTCKH